MGAQIIAGALPYIFLIPVFGYFLPGMSTVLVGTAVANLVPSALGETCLNQLLNCRCQAAIPFASLATEGKPSFLRDKGMEPSQPNRPEETGWMTKENQLLHY